MAVISRLIGGKASCGKARKRVGGFSQPHLFLDLAAGSALVVLGAVVFEWWRRQRRRVWQIYLRELLLVCTLIALALAVWTKEVHQARESGSAIKQLTFGKNGGVAIERGLPEAIRAFTPGDNVRPFDRLVSASSGAPGHFNEADLRLLSKQPHLRSLQAHGARPGSIVPLAACQNLENVWITGSLTDEDFEALATLGRLQQLRIFSGILPPRAFHACGQMSELRQLQLHGRILGTKSAGGEYVDVWPLESVADDAKAVYLSTDLTNLRRLAHLESLSLSKMEIGTDSLRSLAAIKTLKSLRVYECKFDAAEMEELRRLRSDLKLEVDE